MFGLIKTVENLVQVFLSDTVVGNFNHYFLVAFTYGNSDFPSLFGMLECIGYQVVHHLLELLFVIPDRNYVLCLVESECDLPLRGIFLKQQIAFVYKVYQIVFAHFDCHISLLLFAEVEQLGNKLTHLQAVFIYTQNPVVNGRREGTCL